MRLLMMRSLRMRRLVQVALTVGLASGTLHAQAPAALSLSDALARAADANRTVLAARMAKAVDLAGIDAAGQRPNPEISIENERETPRWAFGGTLPLELSGKRGRRVDVANATLAVTEAETARVIADVRADVRRAYFEAVAASRQVQAARDLEKMPRRRAMRRESDSRRARPRGSMPCRPNSRCRKPRTNRRRPTAR